MGAGGGGGCLEGFSGARNAYSQGLGLGLEDHGALQKGLSDQSSSSAEVQNFDVLVHRSLGFRVCHPCFCCAARE